VYKFFIVNVIIVTSSVHITQPTCVFFPHHVLHGAAV